MQRDRTALGSVLRSVGRLMASETRSAPSRLAEVLAQLTQAAEALSQLAESTMATMPLAAAMSGDCRPGRAVQADG